MKKINLDKHFLEKDHMHVTLELKSIGDSLEQVIQHLKHNDFDEAKEHSIELLSSLQTITNLEENKRVYDRHHPELEGVPTFTEFRLVRMPRQ